MSTSPLDEETSMVNKKLEEQYRTGLDLKLSGGARHHKGLGFHGEEASKTDGATSADKAPAEPSKEDSKEDSEVKPSPPPQDSKKDDSSEDVTKAQEENGKEKEESSSKVEMNFVKASR